MTGHLTLDDEPLLHMAEAGLDMDVIEAVDDQLLAEIDRRMPRLVTVPVLSDALLEFVSKLALKGGPSSSSISAKILDTYAFSHQPKGQSAKGIPFGRAAVHASRMCGDLPLERKCLNRLAALCNDAGLPSKGVEYAVNAVDLAEELNDKIGLAASLGNLTSSLKALGLYRETIALGLRVAELSRGEPVLKGVVAQVYGNMAMAAYAMASYKLGVGHADMAASHITAPGSLSESNNLLGILGSGVKSLVALKKTELARARVDQMRAIANAAPQYRRMQLNVALADAVCELAEGQSQIGITRLLALLPETARIPGLYIDNLEALIRVFGERGNFGAMAKHTSELVEQIVGGHIKAVRDLLSAAHVHVVTDQPGKQDAYLLTKATALSSAATVVAREMQEVSREHFERLAVTAELREDSSGRHAYRVGTVARLVAIELGFELRWCDEVDYACRLHDIGKLAIRDAIINKRGAFTAAERIEMNHHTVYGERMLGVDAGSTVLARQVARSHHEWWNGGGYPDRLSGIAIPEVARIATVADVFDALTHERCYKPAWTLDAAFKYIQEWSGTQFEPRVVDAFIKTITRLRRQCPHDTQEQLDLLLSPPNPSGFLTSRDRVREMVDRMPINLGL